MNEYTFNLTNCVRCGREWKLPKFDDGGKYACPCGMNIASVGLDEEVIYCIYYVFGNLHVYWYKDFSCHLYIGETSEDHGDLPWVPFDLTEEQLKIILTFS